MDDGEIDFSNQHIFSDSGFAVNSLPSGSCSLDDSVFEEFFNDTHACTHTHTCNPPGPDHTHTHTCFHVHTKIVPAPEDEKLTTTTEDTTESVEKSSGRPKKRALGNRDAVRKYREKKKAQAVSLEHEVSQLRARVRHLTVMLQGKAALEAENARLRFLLVDVRGRIEGEIGTFPCRKEQNDGGGDGVSAGFPSGYVLNPCDLQRGDDASCLGSGFPAKNGGCELQESGCKEQGSPICDMGVESKEFPAHSYRNASPLVGESGRVCTNKKKGARRTPSGTGG